MYDESILYYEISSYLSNFFVKTKNNDFNFDKFIQYYGAISYKSSQDVYKNFSDVGDFLWPYDSDKYVIKQTIEKIQEKSQISSPYLYIPQIEIMIKKNNNKQDKNDQSYIPSNISEPISTFLNMFSPFIAEFANLNWQISFMNIIEKSVLQAHATMILTKTLYTSKVFKYLKSLWHINLGVTNYIYISQ